MGLETKQPLKIFSLGFLFWIINLFIQACGNPTGPATSSDATVNSEQALVEIPLAFGPSATQLAITAKQLELWSAPQQNGLQLAATPGSVAVDSYVMNLSGCASGLSGNNATAGTIRVYLKDTNCLAKLTSFVLHGNTYLPSGTGSVAFTSWTAGSTAVFASGSSLVNVQVVSQLSSPIQTTDVVSYNFTIISSGTNSASMTVSSGQTLYVSGQDAPNFKINSGGASFLNINSSGAGIFTFNLTCVTGAMTVGANSSYNSFCPNITAGGTIAGGATGADIGQNFSYKLIADPNGNGTLTLAQAQSTFAAGGDTTVNLATDILPGNTGFVTAQLTGPVTISANPKMILVLQQKNSNSSYTSNTSYSSFQYFAITLSTVTP